VNIRQHRLFPVAQFVPCLVAHFLARPIHVFVQLLMEQAVVLILGQSQVRFIDIGRRILVPGLHGLELSVRFPFFPVRRRAHRSFPVIYFPGQGPERLFVIHLDPGAGRNQPLIVEVGMILRFFIYFDMIADVIWGYIFYNDNSFWLGSGVMIAIGPVSRPFVLTMLIALLAFILSLPIPVAAEDVRADIDNPFDDEALPIPNIAGMEHFYGEWWPGGQAGADIYQWMRIHRDGRIT